MSKESALAYYYRNREKQLAKNREWRKNNREYLAKKRREYYRTEKGNAAIKKAIKNHELRNPDHRKAWAGARKVAKNPCMICGSENTHRHHHDHSKPLEVIHLCPLHHKIAHETG